MLFWPNSKEMQIKRTRNLPSQGKSSLWQMGMCVTSFPQYAGLICHSSGKGFCLVWTHGHGDVSSEQDAVRLVETF